MTVAAKASSESRASAPNGPTTSGSAEDAETTTGVPLARASSAESPNV